MNENENSYYNPAQLRKFQEHGVIIPDLSSVRIGREVAFDKIAAGSTLHPFVRINGSNTEIHAGANIGLFGAVTLDNSWIGENAVIGSLGAVTLKDTVVGPESILGSGVAEQAVLLGKETKVNDFSTGYGFRIRKGSLYEEDASSAQHTDTKMTVLFPWTTLGSNINFCDVLLAGGTGPEPGYFSEVGSGTIHFNFSIRGDKATASLFGDVSSGVFLDQQRLFIGGNNSLLGPIKADFGAMTAADVRINGAFSAGLNFGHSLPKGKIAYDPRIFLGALGIVKKQVNVLAELTALFHWYQQIRIACVAQTPQQKFIYESGLRMVELNHQERLSQLQRFIDAVDNSLSLTLKTETVSKKEIVEQKLLLQRWPDIHKQLSVLANFALTVPQTLLNNITEQQAQGNSVYTKLIQKLSQEGKQSGKQWLNTITEKVRNVFAEEIKKGE